MQFAYIVLINIILVFALAGLWFGFIHTLGSALGTVVGAYLASRYYEPVANWLIGFTGWDDHVTRLVVFIIAFFILNRLVGFLFWLAERFLNVITYLPFLGSINHFLGFVLGAVEGIVSVGLVIYFIAKYPLSQPIMDQLANSVVAPFTVHTASLLLPLLPQALRLLESSFDYVEQLVHP